MTNKFLAAFSRTTNRFFLITVVLLLSFMSLSAKTLTEPLFYQSHINANIFQFPAGDFRETIVSPQNTITVNATLMTINGSDGLCTLKEAIIAANTNAVSGMTPGECVAGSSSGADTIVVPAGIYTLTTADNTETNFGTSNGLPLIVSPIIIQGAGASQTVIQRSSAAGTPEFRFFQVTVLTEVGRLTLNDLTLKNGRTANYGAGAIFPYDVLTINNCRFENNSTGGAGGVIGSSFGYTAIINNSTFTANGAGTTGGAISASDLTVINSTFTNNTAAGGGGAISMGHNSTAAISGSIFTNNTVTGESPGGAVNGFTVNISNSTFNGNSAPFSSNNGSGGAVYARFITVDQSAFTNNTAGGNGGAIGNVPTAGAFVTITNSTISGNTANYGGGVYGANTTISNSTVSGNFARESGGGVIFNGSESSLSLNNVTITNNTADSDLSGTGRGGGLFHTYSFGTSQLMNIRNTIIAGNINSNTPDCGTEFGHAMLSQGYNLIGNDTGCNFTSATGDLVGTSSQPINPLLDALQNNGGAGKTHALLAKSPAIDAGNPNTPDGTGNNCLATDQRGAPRPADGDENGTSRCDIGAFEVVELIPTRLAFSVQPTNRTAGQIFNPAIKVEIQDQFGVLMPNETADVTISLASNPGGSALSGTLTRPTVGGVAVFDDVYLNRTGTGYTLQAASGSLTVVTSNAFNITPGAAAQIVFETQPGSSTALAIISPAVKVSVQDAFGNLFTTQSKNITISIGSNAGNGSLSGNVSANTSNNGFVIFNTLSINQPGSDYTLQAGVSGLPSIQSSAFEITRPLFVVTKTADTSDGACNADCSLREAISAANAMNGADTINFNISGSAPFTITPATALPNITDQVTIDGATQSGFTGSSPVVGISGSAIAQNANGLSVTAGNSTIRGLLISGFSGSTSQAINLASNNNVVAGNFIGTDFSGSVALANSTGINVSGMNNMIGGTAPGERNVISGNTVAGIRVSSGGVVIQGNFIGRNAANNGNIGNGRGIHLTTINSTVGGTDAGAGNVIAGNQTGVEISGAGSIKNQIRGNSIYENSNKAISLSSAKPTYNDPRDPDTGPNMLQNYPVLNFALSAGGSTNVRGTFNSLRNGSFTLEFFSNPTCSALGYGEGRTLLGTASVNTANQSGIVGFDVNFGAAVAPGHFITATATDSDGNTSEFSDCAQVGSGFSTISGRVLDSNNNPLANRLVGITGERTRTTTTDRDGNYSFPDLPVGNYTVAPDQRNYNFNPPNRAYNNLNLDQTNQDFTGTRSRYEITAVVKININGALSPLRQTTITVSGSANATRQTDDNGRAVFNLAPSGNYILTPSFNDYIFAPAQINLPNPLTGNMTVEFTAQPPLALNGPLIVYEENKIKTVNPDGSGLSALPIQSADYGSASVSNDGSMIAFTRQRKIYIAPFDGSTETFLTNGEQPDWSPDKTKIVFNGAPDNKLKIFNFAGNTVTSLGLSNVSGFSPKWSPDGTKILFMKAPFPGDRGDRIYSVNSDGTNLSLLASSPVSSIHGYFNPDWSPDGTKILFIDLDHPAQSIIVMNADGSNQTVIWTYDNDYDNTFTPQWSLDGSKIAFLKRNPQSTVNPQRLVFINPDGTGLVNSISGNFTRLSWGAKHQTLTGTGTNVPAVSGGVSLNFNSVTTVGQTNATLIPPNSAGAVQGGFVIGNLAYDVSTTATFTAPITICFTIPQDVARSEYTFNNLKLMHNENGTLIDRTTSHNFATRQICGSVNSLSPFALAEQIDDAKPQISGLVLDSNGNPMSGVRMFLTGEETKETETDTDGSFRFVNLTPGANYNVQPKQLGYIFNSYSQDFVNLSGEQTVVFSGTAAGFAISGQVTDSNGNAISNVTVQLNDGTIAETLTDADGNYTFPNLPADGSYTVGVFDDVNDFSPEESIIEPLLNDVTAVDFMSLPVLSANVSVGGRVMTASGQGIRNVYVTLTEQSGTVHTALTGSFGYYRFDKISVGQIIVVRVFSKRFRFSTPTQVLNVSDIVENLNFTADIQ